MTTDQILSLGSELAEFLREFAGCFGRSEPRGKLETYVRGQLGELPRKSIEPIALAADMKPRTLQEFLASDEWDEDRMAEDARLLVARDHTDPQAIGVIDESGHPKKGNQTAGVSRQYCGNTGKIDNCVMTVHLTYTTFDGQFRTMLDSSLYLPKCWDEDRRRCREAKIPDDVVYRPKYDIALEQLDRAGQRRAFCLDHGGRVVLAEAGLRPRAGTKGLAICAGNSEEFRGLAARSGARTRGRAGKTGGKLVSLLAGDDASTVAALLHQGHRQRTDGVGDQARRAGCRARAASWDRTGW